MSQPTPIRQLFEDVKSGKLTPDQASEQVSSTRRFSRDPYFKVTQNGKIALYNVQKGRTRKPLVMFYSEWEQLLGLNQQFQTCVNDNQDSIRFKPEPREDREDRGSRRARD